MAQCKAPINFPMTHGFVVLSLGGCTSEPCGSLSDAKHSFGSVDNKISKLLGYKEKEDICACCI